MASELEELMILEAIRQSLMDSNVQSLPCDLVDPPQTYSESSIQSSTTGSLHDASSEPWQQRVTESLDSLYTDAPPIWSPSSGRGDDSRNVAGQRDDSRDVAGQRDDSRGMSSSLPQPSPLRREHSS